MEIYGSQSLYEMYDIDKKDVDINPDLEDEKPADDKKKKDDKKKDKKATQIDMDSIDYAAKALSMSPAEAEEMLSDLLWNNRDVINQDGEWVNVENEFATWSVMFEDSDDFTADIEKIKKESGFISVFDTM